jgi:hypothetical protein
MMTPMRTIIDLPEDQLEALASLCRSEGISRAEAIRRAVAQYMGQRRHTTGAAAFGLWRDRPIDGLEFERALRDEWAAGPAKPARRARARR